MSTWIKNLRAVLEIKEVVIIHGNVRDIYIDEQQQLYENLTCLLNSLIAETNFSLRFNRLIFYDASGNEKRQEKENQKRTVSRGSELDSTAPTTGINENIRLDPTRLLAKWSQEMRDRQQNTLLVINYLDKLVPYQVSYSENETRIILWLEKLIENISYNNRLILVALQDSQIPTELYTLSPKVRLVEITLPSVTDRRNYLRHRLDNNLEHLKLISDLTDGLFLRDLDPIVHSLHSKVSPGEVRKIINKFRIGEQEDYWGSLTTQSLVKAKSTFVNDPGFGVKGQDQAVGRVVDMLVVAKAGLSGIGSDSVAKPKGVLFFAGPSGVGKTFLAKKLARFLFSSEEAFIRFDMSEFKEEHTVSKLIGSPPGYVGYEQGGMLTNAIRARPFSVILFDEIEKAHPKIMDIFLQILDDGRLTDSRGQVVFFTEAVIIFTSNIGTRSVDSRGAPTSERKVLDNLLSALRDDLLDEERLKTKTAINYHFLTSVQRFFEEEISRPELLNRIGNNIVPFNYIENRETQKQILLSHFIKIATQFTDDYQDSHLSVRFDESLAAYIIDYYGDQISKFGGRAVSNILRDLVMPTLARYTLNELENTKVNTPVTFFVKVDDGEIVFEKLPLIRL